MSDTSAYPSASEQTRVPPRLPSLDERYPRGARILRAAAASRRHDDDVRRSRRGGSRSLRIAPADGRRRAAAAAGRTGHTVDRRSRVPGRAASSGPPARARGGVQDDQRGVGGDVDPARARLPLPRGRRDQPRNARESRTGACETRARRARLASVPREGPQRGRHDGRPPRDQQPGAAARRRDARRTPKSLARSPDVRQPAAHADAERARTRVPHRAAVQPRSRPARGDADVRCGAGDTGPRISQRGPDSLHHPACEIGAVARARRNGRADGRGLRHSRRAEPRLSVARQAAGARLRVPPAGLPG